MTQRTTEFGAHAPFGGGLAGTRGTVSLGRSAFALAVLSGLLLPAEVCTLLYAALAGLLLARQGRFAWHPLAGLVTPLAGLFLLGVWVDAGAVDGWAFAQDVWRVLKPALLLVLGFTAVRGARGGVSFPRSFVLVGLCYALVYLVRLAQAALAAGVAPLELADTLVVGHFPEALTLGVCLQGGRLGTSSRRAGWLLRRGAFLCAALALALSGSRTWILCALLLLLAGAGWMRTRGRWQVVLLALALLAAVLVTPFGATLFTKGFDVALAEISPARYTTLGDIHENWRGYESWQALRAFAGGTPLQQVFGQGFGAQADLGLTMELGGVDFHEIGQFHNGLIWVLLKTGYAGLLVLALWFFRQFRLCRRLAAQGERAAADLCLGVVLSLCLTTIVVAGVFNPLSNDPLVLALGGFLALAHGTRAAQPATRAPAVRGSASAGEAGRSRP